MQYCRISSTWSEWKECTTWPWNLLCSIADWPTLSTICRHQSSTMLAPAATSLRLSIFQAQSSKSLKTSQDISRHLRTSQDHKKCVVKMGLGRPNCPHDRWEMSPGKTYMSYVWVLTSESLPLSNLTCLTSNSLDALAKLAEVIRPRW